MAGAKHGCDHQDEGCHRSSAEHGSGAKLLQQGGTDKPADHRAAPIERHKPGCNFFGYIADIRLAEVIDQETPDRDFGTNIQKYSDSAEHQMTVLPYALMCCLCSFMRIW